MQVPAAVVDLSQRTWLHREGSSLVAKHNSLSSLVLRELAPQVSLLPHAGGLLVGLDCSSQEPAALLDVPLAKASALQGRARGLCIWTSWQPLDLSPATAPVPPPWQPAHFLESTLCS